VLALRNVFDAADPALLEVTLLGAFRCESADPEADFAALLAVLLLSVFDAAVAAFFPVTSLLPITFFSSLLGLYFLLSLPNY
jgi:hypothetical protein